MLTRTLQKLVANSCRGCSTSSLAERFCLTRRELECVTLVVCGLTQAQIAHYLNISINTTKHYICNCRNKLRCKNRFELISFILNSKYGYELPEIYRSIMKKAMQREANPKSCTNQFSGDDN